MNMMIILLIAFLVLVYIYTFVKIRKIRKANNSSSAVSEFKEKYLKDKTISDKQPNPNYNKYVTKYNSNLDYISKEEP